MAEDAWNRMWSSEANQATWREPDGDVVRLIGLLKSENVRRVLDVGCGLGRHVVLFAAEGFDVDAYDSSSRAVEYCLENLRAQGLAARVSGSDVALTEYCEGCFDFVLCWNVIYHSTLSEMIAGLEEIWRITRDRGLAYFTFNSVKNKNYGVGKEIEPGTYDNPKRDRGHHIHHYSDEHEIRRLLRRWHMEALMHKEEQLGSTVYPGSWHWMARVRKVP